MGLDIYFHKVGRQFDGDPSNPKDFSNFRDEVDKDAQNELSRFIKRELKPLEAAWEDGKDEAYRLREYNRLYFAFVEKLRKIIAKNFEFKIEPYCQRILPLDELKAKLDKEVEMHYEPYNAYFRKVNFLFKYFEDKDKMFDECYAFVDESDVVDIITRCELVLENHETAPEYLPTQDGFFFGSTSYNEWYFYDVKDCLKQMKKFLKLFKNKKGTAYVIFSW